MFYYNDWTILIIATQLRNKNRNYANPFAVTIELCPIIASKILYTETISKSRSR